MTDRRKKLRLLCIVLDLRSYRSYFYTTVDWTELPEEHRVSSVIFWLHSMQAIDYSAYNTVNKSFLSVPLVLRIKRSTRTQGVQFWRNLQGPRKECFNFLRLLLTFKGRKKNIAFRVFRYSWEVPARCPARDHIVSCARRFCCSVGVRFHVAR